MLTILKVPLSFATDRKLKLSMTQIEHLTAQVMAVMVMAMFLTTLVAMAIAVGLFSLHQGLIAVGLSGLFSGPSVAFALIVIIGLSLAVISSYMKSIRLGLKSVARFETPVVGPVVHQVSNVAQSFISGLIHTPNPKGGSANRLR
jgi:hypothetical protein